LKNAIIISSALLALSAPAQAQVALSSTQGVSTSYTLPDLGVRLYDKPVLQGVLSGAFPYGTWTNIYWTTDPRFQDGASREIDYAAGWSNEWITVGAIYFDLNELFGLEPYGDIIEGLAELSHTWKPTETQKIVFRVQANFLYATKDPDLNNGTYPYVAAMHTWSKGVFVLQSDTLVTYDSGIFQADPGVLSRVRITPNVQVTDWLAFGLPLRINSPLYGAKDRKLYFTASLNSTLSHTFLDPPAEGE